MHTLPTAASTCGNKPAAWRWAAALEAQGLQGYVFSARPPAAEAPNVCCGRRYIRRAELHVEVGRPGPCRGGGGVRHRRRRGGLLDRQELLVLPLVRATCDPSHLQGPWAVPAPESVSA